VTAIEGDEAAEHAALAETQRAEFIGRAMSTVFADDPSMAAAIETPELAAEAAADPDA
jgi:hypothetical protein